MTTPAHKIFEFGPFRLDTEERVLLRDGQPVPLTLKAFDVLLLLVENSGHIVEKDQLMNRVWAGSFVEEGNLKVTVSMLRKSLGENNGGARYIETVPRRGYRFASEVKDLTAESVDLVVHERTRETVTIDEIRIDPGRSKSRRLPYLLAGALLIVLGIVGFFWLKSRTRSVPPNVSAAPIKSIAVLPFKPLVAGSRDESLELGMADTLITRLGGIKAVFVRPTSAVRKYSGLEQDPVAAGRELNVDAVLDGSIQKAGDRIRITVRLIRVADGSTLWADQFDGHYVDIFAVQDSISSKVIGTLALKLGGDESRLLSKRYTDNTAAFEAYAKGRHHWNKQTKESWEKGIDHFREAIRLDPNYALAYAGIADSYNMMGYWGVVPPRGVFPKAKEAAKKSLEIDPTLAEAHCALAYAKFEYDWNLDDAESEYQRAISLNPGYASAHQWYAEYLLTTERTAEAETELKRAREIDPLSQPINLIWAALFYVTRRYDGAIEHLQKMIELDPNYVVAYTLLAACYEKKGMYEQAVKAYERESTLSGENAQTVAALRETYQTSGMPAYWRKRIDLMKERSTRTYISPIWIAMDYANLGDKERTLEWLEKAYEERSGWLLELKIDPTWDKLRTDSRFKALVERVRISRITE